MNNEDWRRMGISKPSWIYYPPLTSTQRQRDTAVITVVHNGEWQLHVNHKYVATFNSWDEARDATPMMIALHGYGANK